VTKTLIKAMRDHASATDTTGAFLAPVGLQWHTRVEATKSYTYIPADSEIPALYAQDGKGDDAIVYVKLFDPSGSWTWYLTECDRKAGQAFGLVHGHEPELGYVDLTELARAGRLLPIERDIRWRPRTMGEVRKEIGQ